MVYILTSTLETTIKSLPLAAINISKYITNCDNDLLHEIKLTKINNNEIH